MQTPLPRATTLAGQERGRPRHVFDPSDLRTVALVGHRSCGKTSLAEVLLQAAGVTRAIGRVRDGTSLLDHTAVERKRGMSLQPDVAWLEWPDPVAHDEVRLLNLIDTPGSEAVSHDRRLACLAADAVLAVLDAGEGVELGAELGLADAVALAVPRFVCVARLDRAHDVGPILSRLKELPGIVPVAIALPSIGANGELRGILSVLDGKLHPVGSETEGAPPACAVPEDERAALASARETLAEAVALTDDCLLETYLEYLALTDDQLRDGLRAAVRAGLLTPVLFGNASPPCGARLILDTLVDLAPSPVVRGSPRGWSLDGEPVVMPLDGPFVAQWVASGNDAEGQSYRILRVWAGTPPKNGLWTNGTSGEVGRVRKLYQLRGPRRAGALVVGPGSLLATWDPLPGVPGDAFTEGSRLALAAPEPAVPMVAAWIAPVTAEGRLATPRSNEEQKFAAAVGRILMLDPSVWAVSDGVEVGRIVHAANEAQLVWFVERLAEWFGVRCRRELAPVPYRECPIAAVTNVEGEYRIEDASGCATAFGRVSIDVEPAPVEIGRVVPGVEVENYLADDDVPTAFHDDLLRGIGRGLAHGPRGYPIAGATVRLVGGDHDLLASTGEHFAKAGESAVQAALERCGTRLAEPWVQIVVWLPPASTGDVLSELGARRGRIAGIEVAGGDAAIHATVPYRELRTFGARIQGQTGGRGRFVSGDWHWEPLPPHLYPESRPA